MEKINSHFISSIAIARDALRQLDELPDSTTRLLFVLEGKKLIGTLTDGDIRRGLLNNREISEGVSLYMNQSFKRLRKEDVNPESLAKFRSQDIWMLPVLNVQGEIEQVINLKEVQTIIPAAALLMAGGRGERLRPLTDALPKPMLTVGDKPILEINIDRLIHYGFKNFYISVRYLSEKIIEYFGEDHLLVMNADLLTNIDFEDMYNNYKNSAAAMCAASIPYNVKVPYGIMQTNDKDEVTGLVEKPTYTHYANAGIYLLNKKLLSGIPENTFYNTTDLMQELINNSKGLIHYPIRSYWLDIGKYEDFARAQQDFKHINF